MAGPYNAAADLIDRNLRERPDKVAVIDDKGSYTFTEVAARADRCGAAFLGLGTEAGDRIALCLQDSVDFFACYLGAMKAGLAPIPLNTLFQPEDYAYILADSGAKAVVVSQVLAPQIEAAIAISGWAGALIISGADGADPRGLAAFVAAAPASADGFETGPDDAAFWLYSSGSTGRPKGTVHLHRSPLQTAELYAQAVAGFREDDIVFSAAKLFFAYGLGNALTFPMSVGATAVLYAGRVTPAVVGEMLASHGVTVFCGVPTLYAGLLASDALPPKGASPLRLCLSAGESLPEEVGRTWFARTGVHIVDGIGSTEMLHIYVSNRPDDVRYGTTGLPVPGYEVKLIDETGAVAGPGEAGELYVRGPSCAAYYWNNPQKTASTFVDGWIRTGDKFRTEDGRLIHCGRDDDMLKVSGIWVSPGEVENALMAHEAVLECAVIGVADKDGLIKSKAFVVAKPGASAGPELAQALQAFAKSRLAAYKYPRAIEFVDDLPKTATGKIRRHVLREREAAKT